MPMECGTASTYLVIVLVQGGGHSPGEGRAQERHCKLELHGDEDDGMWGASGTSQSLSVPDQGHLDWHAPRDPMHGHDSCI